MLNLLAPSAVQSFPMFGGDMGTAQTINRIRDLVARGKKSIEINRLAIGIVWPTPQFSQTEKAQAIFDWVQRNTRFIPMIVNAQTLRTPEEILRVQAGDCTNLNAILIPSLLETVGIPARLVTIAGDAADPGEFTHVYAEAFVDGRWMPMDVARPGAAFGRAPERAYRKRIWDLGSSEFQDVPGLSGVMVSRSRRGMGDAQDDFNDALQAVAAATNSASTLIRAENSPASVYGVYGQGTLPAPPAGYTYNAAGQLVPSSGITATTVGSLTGSQLLLLVGLGLGVLFLVRR